MPTRQIFQQFDVVGIHLYEPLRNANALSARATMIDAQLDDCARPAFADAPLLDHRIWRGLAAAGLRA